MNYCTLFNSQYLSRGLALYYSLLRNAASFHLYIIAFDDKAFQILTSLKLSCATIISLQEFETQELLKVKPTRTIAEYCWTCTSSVILHCLEKYQLAEVCYLDADLYFWADPQCLIEEARESSILITEHRYSKEYDHSAVSGKYCVQFMYFKNDAAGLKALQWWKAACLEWCYNRVEPGRFGDQKYLDDWLERFEKVKVLEHLGGGVAPWNVQQYHIKAASFPFKLKETSMGYDFDLIFYHFHGLKFINNKVDFGGYALSSEIKASVYQPYVNELLNIENKLRANELINTMLDSVNLHCRLYKPFSLNDLLRNIKNKLWGKSNLYSLASFKG